MYCRKCGHKNEDEARFCAKCGEPMGEVIAEIPVKKTSMGKKKPWLIAIPLILVLAAAMYFIMQPRYEQVGDYNGYGLAKAEWKEKYGYIDEKKHAVIPVKYDDVGYFDDFGLVMVQKDGYSGLYDSKGNEILPVEYGEILRNTEYSDNGLRFVEYDGTGMFLNRENESAYDEVTESEIENYYIVKKNKKYGCVDGFGDIVLKCEFNDIEMLDRYYEILKVKLDGQTNFITTSGEIRYDSVGEENELGWAMVYKGDKCGYIDETGQELIPLEYSEIILGEVTENAMIPITLDGENNFISTSGEMLYASVGEFSANGLAVVCDEYGYYGYANQTGENVIPCYYEEAEDFGDANLARVRSGSKWGFVNKLGVCVIAPSYDNAERFNDSGYAYVQNGKVNNFVSESGIESYEYVEEFANDAAIAKRDEQYSLVGKDGILLTDNWYDHIYSDSSFMEAGIFRARKDGKYVILNDQGQEISEYYDGVDSWIYNGKIVCWKDKMYQVLDGNGNELLAQPQYYVDIDHYVGAIVVTNENGKEMVYSPEGKKVLQQEYDSIDVFSNGLISNYSFKVCNNEKYGVYSSLGEEILKEEYDDIISNDFYMSEQTEDKRLFYGVQKDGKFALADEKGKMLTSFLYDDMLIIDNMVKVKCDERWGALDFNGDTILACKYLNIRKIEGEESWSFIVANEQKKFGCINDSGEEVIPLQYDLLYYSSGMLHATIEGKEGLLNSDGDWIIPAKYDEAILWDNDNGTFVEVVLDDKNGIIDLNQNVIIPIIYDEIRAVLPDENGEAYAKIIFDELYGVINQDYEIIISPQYTNIIIYDNYDYVCRAETMDGDVSLIDKHGNTLISEANWISGVGTNGLVVVNWTSDDDYYYIYNYKGEYISTVNAYNLGKFECGLAAICIDGKWGYINTKAEEVIECVYDDANMFSDDGIARVQIGENWGYIDEQGNAITDFVYSYAEDFQYGFAKVSELEEDKGIGYISVSGQVVVPLQYEDGSHYDMFYMEYGDTEDKYYDSGSIKVS